MQVVQTPTFAKAVKKLHKSEKKGLDNVVKTIIAFPLSGELKIADLSSICVYKFRMNKQLALLAYGHRENAKKIILLMFGSHENFYRDLKKSG